MNPTTLLQVLEGNRGLTLRVARAFPGDSLITYSPVAPLRPFAEMLGELVGIEEAYVRGIATGEWRYEFKGDGLKTPADWIARLEASRTMTLALWPKVTAERLATVEDDGFFGQGPVSNLDRMIYALENEVHHRGQAYVYLRMLGVEPPAFYER